MEAERVTSRARGVGAWVAARAAGARAAGARAGVVRAVAARAAAQAAAVRAVAARAAAARRRRGRRGRRQAAVDFELVHRVPVEHHLLEAVEPHVARRCRSAAACSPSGAPCWPSCRRSRASSTARAVGAALTSYDVAKEASTRCPRRTAHLCTEVDLQPLDARRVGGAGVARPSIAADPSCATGGPSVAPSTRTPPNPSWADEALADTPAAKFTMSPVREHEGACGGIGGGDDGDGGSGGGDDGMKAAATWAVRVAALLARTPPPARQTPRPPFRIGECRRAAP